MERFSMTSTFIARLAREVKTPNSKSLEFKPDPRVIHETHGFVRIVVTPGRLELPTRSLGNCCSIHLSYGATLESIIYNHI